jgi:hypothetical protein
MHAEVDEDPFKMLANPQTKEWMMHQPVMDCTHVDIYALMH